MLFGCRMIFIEILVYFQFQSDPTFISNRETGDNDTPENLRWPIVIYVPQLALNQGILRQTALNRNFAFFSPFSVTRANIYLIGIPCCYWCCSICSRKQFHCVIPLRGGMKAVFLTGALQSLVFFISIVVSTDLDTCLIAGYEHVSSTGFGGDRILFFKQDKSLTSRLERFRDVHDFMLFI